MEELDENKNQDQENKAPATEKTRKEVNFFAETNYRNGRVKFGIKRDDRRRHMYLIGKTGMGKSNAMENMIIQDIWNGEGVALVDPHGDFAEKILDFIPNERINDVVYLNPADMEFPVAFNIIESVSAEHKHLVASGLVGVFKKLWADSWGPRLEYLLRNAILALLDYPGSTLLGVMRILTDKTYRNKVIEKIQDPVVRAFWVDEFSKYPLAFQVEAIAPIQNKVGQFLSNGLIRNVVGQVKSSIDIREIMDSRKILIMNLSKGRIGEDSSALLGAMMITKIQLAAMSRVDIAEDTRKDFFLYVDEFQNFATESFANILSEARKYRLDLIIGHQYIEQLDEIVRAAVFGNVGTMMVFRVGAADAAFLETEFMPHFTPEDLVNLTKYDVYMKLMIDGVSSNPFSATTLPPLGKEFFTGNRDKVIRVSRERYATPRAEVEEKISRWTGVMMEGDIENRKELEASKGVYNRERKNDRSQGERRDDVRPAASRSQVSSTPRPQSDRPRREGDAGSREKKEPSPTTQVQQVKPIGALTAKPEPEKKKTFAAICANCGKTTELNFEPKTDRPVYCNDCFRKLRDTITKTKSMPVEKPVVSLPTISLSAALQQPVVPFERRAKKIERPEPSAATRPVATTPITPVKPEPVATQDTEAPSAGTTSKREEFTPHIEQIAQPIQPPVQQTPSRTEPQSTSSAKPLSAGEVINF